MLSYDDAVTQILNRISTLTARRTLLSEALGCVTAEDVVTPYPFPPFTNSAMDGYAARHADLQAAGNDAIFPVAFEVAAGNTQELSLPKNSLCRILTGAPLPGGADTVIPQEDVTLQADGSIKLTESVQYGQFVRNAGEEASAGNVVVPAGTTLKPAHLGIIAAAGQNTIAVITRPQVAIVSTGDELVDPGMPLKHGQIYNSNTYTLAAQVRDSGGIVAQQCHALDNKDDLNDAFDQSMLSADIIISSGGVSVGMHDHVRTVIEMRGGVLDFWRVAIRPGKPFAFGSIGNAFFFGLPGNPTSSMVTFELFVRPVLLKMRGLTQLSRPTVLAQTLETVSHEPGRRSFQRVIVHKDHSTYYARIAGNQGSGRLQAMAAANGLLILPEDIDHIAEGKEASVLLLDAL